MQNWIDCIAAAKQPNATVEQGHYGADGVQLGNLAWTEKRLCPGRRSGSVTRLGWLRFFVCLWGCLWGGRRR